MTPTRKRRKPSPRQAEFRAALALNRENSADWARRHGVHPSHLSMVLNGARESGRLDAAVDAYITDFRTRVARSAMVGA